jgi:hypothetical protein
VHGVLVVRISAIQEEWGDPNCPATEALYVWKLLPQTNKIASMSEAHVTDVELAIVDLVVSGVPISKPICQELIDGERPPILWGGKVRVTVP